MSNAATVAVMTCDVSLLMEIKIIFLQICSGTPHVVTARGWRSLTYRHVDYCTTSSIGAHLVLASLVALLVVGSERHVKPRKKEIHVFFSLKPVF